MENIAKLFEVGDKEHKGFLIRRDMQRLQKELELSADQLEAVFDSLDNESQGYLTLDKFLLGYSKHRSSSKSFNSKEAGLCEKDDILIPSEIGCLIDDISNNMFLSKTTSDHLKELSQIISDGQLRPVWEELLSSLDRDMKRTEDHLSQRENLITTRETEHKAYVNKLFEDMEVQLREEKERVLEEEAKKFSAFTDQIVNELERKADEVERLSKRSTELDEKLTEALVQEQKFKAILDRITCDQKVYASHIENLQKTTLELQNELERMKADALTTNQAEYYRGFRAGQVKATFEEDSFIQQMKILRNMQNILSPDHIDKFTVSSD